MDNARDKLIQQVHQKLRNAADQLLVDILPRLDELIDRYIEAGLTEQQIQEKLFKILGPEMESEEVSFY